MRSSIRAFLWPALAAASLVLAACTSTPTGSVDAVHITGVPSPANLAVGETVQLGVDVVVSGGASRAVHWASGDATVASVDATGLVTASAPGSVTITATSSVDATASDSAGLSVLAAGNHRPVADAGLDATVVASPSQDVSLDGSGSSDPDGDALSYAWTVASAPAGSNASLAGAATAHPTFKADLAGDYHLMLEVSDGTLGDDDTVVVHAECPDPIEVGSAIVADETWGVDVRNCPDYLVTRFVQVGATLTVQPGTHVQFASAAGLWVYESGGGAIHAVGTADAPIVFDGADPTPGSWKTLQFSTANPNNELTHVVVDGGGQPLTAIPGGSIVVSNGGRLKITHSVLRNGAKYAIEVTDGTSETALHDFADNSYQGNGAAPLDVPAATLGGLDGASDYNPVATPNAQAYIHVRRGFLTSTDATFPATNVPYRFVDRLEVQSTHVVTIEPGAVLEFAGSSAYIDVQDGSQLVAQGTAAAPIAFRGVSAGQGTWGGLRFLNAGASTLDHASVSGGGSDGRGNIVLQGTSGTLTLTNSTVADSGGFGVYVYAGNATDPADPTSVAANNTFDNNLSGDVGP